MSDSSIESTKKVRRESSLADAVRALRTNPPVFFGLCSVLGALIAWGGLAASGILKEIGGTLAGDWVFLGLCVLIIGGSGAALFGTWNVRRRRGPLGTAGRGPFASDDKKVDGQMAPSEALAGAAVTEVESVQKAEALSSSSGTIDASAGLLVDRQQPYAPKVKPLWNNWISMCGFLLAALAVGLILTFGLFSIVSPSSNPYVDIVGYLILPIVLGMGLGAIPLGIFFRSWRLHRRNPEQKLTIRLPRVDLNDPVQRRAAKYVFCGGLAVVPVAAVSSYHGYHFTDSTEFCAKACHVAMAPQATAYENSAHARVTCAECHIGSGASWFVKSKLSGTRQVLAMWQNSFSRPIPPAITDLRPARETCERCHWPKKFFGAQLREIVHFASDEKNTRREVAMLLRTGGGDQKFRAAEGIHAHMAFADDFRIEYIAIDDKLQVIPWVKMTDRAGNEKIFRSDGRPSSDPRPDGILRTLDCMDCHNRPAHKFRSPQDSVDIAMDCGGIDTTLPFIKREAVRALVMPYTDTRAAEAQIGLSLTGFYKDQYPDVWTSRRAAVYQAIDSVRDIYRHSFFPDMNVDWRTYPDNIGHKVSAGCFRCHEGNHIDQRGEIISHACDICHTFLNPVRESRVAAIIEKGEFIHPMELPGRHAKLRCSECHTGGPSQKATCTGCHVDQQAFYGGTLAALSAFDVEPDPMFDSVDCESCHDWANPLSAKAVGAMCLDCHDDEPEKYEGLLDTWLANLAMARDAAEVALTDLDRVLLEQGEATLLQGDIPAWLDQARGILGVLRRAGPQHNQAAAMKVYATIAREALEHVRTLTVE